MFSTRYLLMVHTRLDLGTGEPSTKSERTLVELALSTKVKVLFGPETNGKPLIKDLDADILAKDPRTSSRGHWLATQLIQRLRQPVSNVGDLLAILSQRSTSWQSDRVKIAALLARVPNCNFDAAPSDIVQKIIIHLGKIPHTCLFHGKSTMKETGGFSWCPALLDDMPFDVSVDMQGGVNAQERAMLRVDENGAAQGLWHCLYLLIEDIKDNRIIPFGDEPAAAFKIDLALEEYPESCLLLQPFKNFGNRALLVASYGLCNESESRALNCGYIGTVVTHGLSNDKRWTELRLVRLGEANASGNEIVGGDAIQELEVQLRYKAMKDEAAPQWYENIRANMRDEVWPGSKAGHIYVGDSETELFGKPEGANPPPSRLLSPAVYDLNKALMSRNEPVVRWILRRKPELVNYIIPYLKSNQSFKYNRPEKRMQIGKLLLKIMAQTGCDSTNAEVYKDLVEFCEDRLDFYEDGLGFMRNRSWFRRLNRDLKKSDDGNF